MLCLRVMTRFATDNLMLSSFQLFSLVVVAIQTGYSPSIDDCRLAAVNQGAGAIMPIRAEI